MNIFTKNEIRIRKMDDGGLPMLEVSGIGELDLAKTFDCGQSFRFEQVSESRHGCEWGGIAYGRAVSFASEGEKLYIYNSDERDFENIWRSYLGLDVDYSAIATDILGRSDSPDLASAVEYGRGIRILRQDRWETLCSFIISQNNNIPRIKKLVSAVSESMGEPIDTSLMIAHGATDERGYAFPSPRAVAEAGVEALAGLKTGFRAKYIYDAATKVSGGELDLSLVGGASVGEAAEMLCTVKGVGPKVAACTLLFGFGRLEAFPVDVWIKRAVEKYFPGDFNTASLGPYAGVAQQYLFYYERYLGGDGKA